jgi:hypothetical protein
MAGRCTMATDLAATHSFPVTALNDHSSATKPIDVSIAANPNGLGYWPKASATYTFDLDDPYKAIDGFLFYDSEPDNRRTNYQSPNSNDTLTIQLARPRNMTSIVLAIYEDNNRSPAGSVACPASIHITDAKNETLVSIQDFASRCLPNDKKVIVFDDEVETETVNVNFTPLENFAVAVCEVEIWVPADTGDFYYAADALALSAVGVVFDSSSTATSNGAVLSPYNSNSEIDFSGIYSANGGSAGLSLSCKHNDTSTVELRVSVNQIAAGNVTPQKLKDLDTTMLRLTTLIYRIYGGGGGVYIEGPIMQ